MLEASAISKQTKIDLSIVERLLQGATKEQLHELIGRLLDKSPDGPEVDIARMNAVGGLRGYGYQVTGGRSGGKVYKIVGWEEPATYWGRDRWEGEERDILDWVHSLSAVTQAWVEPRLKVGPIEPLHERCWMYVACYELARDLGFCYEGRSGDAIIMQRFRTQPRVRLFNLTMTDPIEVLELLTKLAKASLTSSRVLNISVEMSQQLKPLDTAGSVASRQEAVYRVSDIADHPELFFNKRAMTTLRKLGRDLTWGRSQDTEAMLAVIKTWKAHNESRHRQLAITRDYRSLDSNDQALMFLGKRDDLPVCAHILDILPAQPTVVAQITEKSLNYRAMPGGAYGTADYNLLQTCRWLAEHGVDRINAGSFAGGGWGLPGHKRRFAREEDDLYGYSFFSSAPHLDREKYRVRI